MKWALLALVYFAIITVSCGDSVKYQATRRTPNPPVIISLSPGTLGDTVPAVKISFSYNDTVTATIMVDTSSDSGAFGIKVYNVPVAIGSYFDSPLPTNSEVAFIKRNYRLFAVSSFDSVSLPSADSSIMLMGTPPIIDSVSTVFGYPSVYFRIDGRVGVERRVELVKNDSVWASNNKSILASGSAILEIYHFSEFPLDTLRARVLRMNSNNTFGVRVILTEFPATGAAYGIAAAPIHVK